MASNQFPYRAIGTEAISDELQLRTERIKQRLATITQAAGQIGEDLEWALHNIRAEIYFAWLFSEFRWSAALADSFAEVAVLGHRCDPDSALRVATNLGGTSIAMRELTKVKDLLQAYRDVLQGDAAFRWSSRKPRSSMLGRPRVRSRVYRAGLRRETRDSEDDTE